MSEEWEHTQTSQRNEAEPSLLDSANNPASNFNLPMNNFAINVPLQQQPEMQISAGRQKLRKWLGKTFRVVITDGRVLVGFFNCTDKDANVVLSMCAEYLEEGKDARILGNVMIPGKHIVSIAVDMPKEEAEKPTPPLPAEAFTTLLEDAATIQA